MTNVFVAIYEHRHGTDARVFATEAGARAWKDELAREHWSDYCEGDPPSEGVGDAYFEAAGDYSDGEFFSLEEHPIQGELIMTWKCPKCGSKDLRVLITATARLVQYDDNFETEIDSDHEWDERANMVCNSCDFTSESHDFEEPT